MSSWIPALQGVQEKLEAGARVADVGCGKGASTLLMAKAFPKSRFFGFDYHDKSIEGARDSAKREGVADRVTFEVAKAKEYPGKDYDFVAVFDCLHDMGDPVGAAKHVRQSLGKDGTWMIVEPFANDELEGQPESRGPGLLFVLDSAVYAMFAIPGSGAVPGCASGRGAHSRSGDIGGFHSFSASHGNAFQYRL